MPMTELDSAGCSKPIIISPIGLRIPFSLCSLSSSASVRPDQHPGFAPAVPEGLPYPSEVGNRVSPSLNRTSGPHPMLFLFAVKLRFGQLASLFRSRVNVAAPD